MYSWGCTVSYYSLLIYEDANSNTELQNLLYVIGDTSGSESDINSHAM
jgi:uncharacterized FAD-dependent dehydrogenase